ncbi:MAG TPA: TAXI family TRAP transporter solute-binding subunit [Methylomirabilota bacterium]|jgi:TRAP transporter TAXI family solute receptor
MSRRALAPAVRSRLALPAVAAMLAGVALVGVAMATDVGVITGGEGGTYYHFGQDLKRLLKPNGIDVTVHASKGAVDNVYAVSQRPGVQLAIVQSDVLAFVAEQQSNPTLARIAQGLRLVFPLYDEDVHVLSRRGHDTLEALAGKRVAVGWEGSGTYLTARQMFKLADVAPGEMVAIDGADALAQLKAGRIDALVSVIAQPVARFRTDVRPEDGLALVPITSRAILDRYAAAEIPAGAYGWQTAPVPTVTVKAVLVAYDLDRRDCEIVGRIAQHVAAGLDWLVRHGHPYWKRVDLEAQVKGWPPYDCARKYVGQPSDASSPAASAGERNPIADAIKDALDKKR